MRRKGQWSNTVARECHGGEKCILHTRFHVPQWRRHVGSRANALLMFCNFFYHRAFLEASRIKIYLTTWHNFRGGCSEIGILIEIQGIHLRYRIITGVDTAPLPKQYLIGRSRCSQNVWFDFVVVSLLLLIGWTENRKIIIKHFLKTKAKIFAWGLEGCEILRLANSIDGGSGRSLRRE